LCSGNYGRYCPQVSRLRFPETRSDPTAVRAFLRQPDSHVTQNYEIKSSQSRL
jgi:hypothetical protein